MLDNKLYNRIFQQDKDGVAILEDLTILFYDKMGYKQGCTGIDLAFAEGQRSVIKFILNKSGVVTEDD